MENMNPINVKSCGVEVRIIFFLKMLCICQREHKQWGQQAEGEIVHC